jgi:hypothetical protein
MVIPEEEAMSAGSRIVNVAILATFAVAATGCASIIKGGDQSVSFKSDPTEAKLVITDLRDGKDIHSGTTPFTTSLKRSAGYFQKAKYKIAVDKPGYQREEVMVEGTPNGWYIGGNFMFGGLIGWLIVDPLTGGMWTLDPEDVNVTLKKASAAVPRDMALTVMLHDSVPDEVRAKMKPIKVTVETP